MSKTLFLTLLLLPILSHAQVSPNVSLHYPAHIVYKIDDLLGKIKLSEDKQIKIAQKSIKYDSIANASLAKGIPIEGVKNYIAIDKAFLKDILSTEEIEKYCYEIDKDNRFLATLINASIIKLEPKQINKIRQLNDSLENTPKGATREYIQFQNWKLSTILNKEQYTEIIKFSYKDQSIVDAKKDWERILKLKINTPGKEKEEYQKIKNYHFTKNGFLDKKADRFEKKIRDFLSIKATVFEPPLLIRANILSNEAHANNKYASILEYEKELELSASQIDTLLIKYKQFENIKIENKENELIGNNILPKPLPVELENIVKIITPEQLSKWFVFKNKKGAIKKAQESWAKLDAEGLTKDLDKNNTIGELTIYHLKLLIALEKSKSWKTPETLFLVRDVEQQKPQILQQLDALTRSKTKNENAKNALAW